MPFELRPEPHPTLRPEGEYLQRAWSQSVYPLARRMGVPIVLPQVSPQPHTHLAFEGFQYAKEHGKANEYNHRVLEAFFREGQDIGDTDVLTKLAGEVGLDEQEFERVVADSEVSGCSPVCPATRLPGGRGRGRADVRDWRSCAERRAGPGDPGVCHRGGTGEVGSWPLLMRRRIMKLFSSALPRSSYRRRTSQSSSPPGQ